MKRRVKELLEVNFLYQVVPQTLMMHFVGDVEMYLMNVRERMMFHLP
jgi:hypothetical protein